MKSLFRVITAIFILGATVTVDAQMTVTTITNQNVKQILREQFLGKGVTLDTTHPIYFNNQTTINSNQIGTFTNTDTSAESNGVPISSGLMLATCAVSGITGGSSTPTNPLFGAATNSPSLYYAYQDFVNDKSLNLYGCTMGSDESKFNDVAVLDFWVIPSSFEMSFRYCFGSQEYPQYVCSQYNDFFGLFVDGPYNEDGSQYYDEGVFYENPTNIAIIPGTSIIGDPYSPGTPVMINTCNNGNSSQSCGIDNEEFFIDNRSSLPQHNSSTILGGYTKKLQTNVVATVPCKSYHVQIAICNINDGALQSAVFLEANSFSSDRIDIYHEISQSNDTMEKVTLPEDVLGTKYVYLKGCSSDTMIMRANYISDGGDPDNPYTFLVKPSTGSSLVRGEDYEYYKVGDTYPATNNDVLIPKGESEVKYVLHFLHNEDKLPGTYDTLWFISEDLSSYPCLGTDTIKYVMKEPDDMICTVVGGHSYCEDKLPQIDSIYIRVENGSSPITVTYTKGDNTGEHIVRYDVLQTTKLALDTIAIPLYSSADGVDGCKITITDSCSHVFDTIIYDTILGTQTSASVSKDYICEGDTVKLSCPASNFYQWTCNPADPSLKAERQDTTQAPQVSPKQNTEYYLKVTSSAGCVAFDTVSVQVEKRLVPNMTIKPKDPKYSDPEIYFEDLTANTFVCSWDFGDGATSDRHSGYHTYIVNDEVDTNIFPVTLIVYNKAMCADTLRDTVTLVADFTIYVPNAFMPKSDMETVTKFGPKGSLLTYWQMKVYDRWGALVFDGQPLQEWDGKYKGGFVPQDTYVYIIEYEDGRGNPQRIKGTVALIH